ncbi:hypothetical protein SSX86_009556 [Deinandra increscens subsp. villosa]|uniref:MORF/ORRM1/DAG-like MORF domain-containing protein n=1 Tax=Deinandra increscens subsp. villosa TaxID=3103831 RepID=A0AAP0DH53_9ASTR
MAANALRLRRSLALSSAILNHPSHLSSNLPSVAARPSSTSTIQQNPSLFNITQSKSNALPFQFISSSSFSSRSRYNDDMDGDQISPDAILFEGCDYNHWLITIDFPKDPKPSPEEMVETYVQTAAKFCNLSVEEAKKKIYACSTTTYNGFQVEVSEEVSEQFKSIPGVVFVLPDSYIDPVNKEYGGDKYINGTIIPRPPPVQYGRQSGRYNDRNREYNRPPRGQFEQNNASGGPGNYQRGPTPSNQVNYNQGEVRSLPPRDQGNYAQPGQRDFRGPGSNFTPSPGGGYNQGGGGGYRQGPGGQYDQGRGGQYGQGGGGGSYGQGAGGQYGQTGGGNYGQGAGGQYGQVGGGNYTQGGGGNYGNDTGGQYQQGSGYGGNQTSSQYQQGSGYGGNQTSSQYGENPTFSQVGLGQRGNDRRQQGNYEAVEEAEAFKV